MNETRKNPSPPAPNALPGRTITPSSSISRSANCALGMPSGNGIQRYIVAFGDSQSKPDSLNAATAASRRSRNVARLPGRNDTIVGVALNPERAVEEAVESVEGEDAAGDDDDSVSRPAGSGVADEATDAVPSVDDEDSGGRE